jgi:hypothetical protein
MSTNTLKRIGALLVAMLTLLTCVPFGADVARADEEDTAYA